MLSALLLDQSLSQLDVCPLLPEFTLCFPKSCGDLMACLGTRPIQFLYLKIYSFMPPGFWSSFFSRFHRFWELFDSFCDRKYLKKISFIMTSQLLLLYCFIHLYWLKPVFNKYFFRNCTRLVIYVKWVVFHIIFMLILKVIHCDFSNIFILQRCIILVPPFRDIYLIIIYFFCSFFLIIFILKFNLNLFSSI